MIIVIAQKHGRLGNRLLLFSHIIAFAKEHNLLVLNPAFEEYAGYFEATSQDLFCRFPPRKLSISSQYLRQQIFSWTRRLREDGIPASVLKITGLFKWISIDFHNKLYFDELSNQEEVLNIKNHLVTFIDGWRFRDYTAFAKHIDLVREFFTPAPKYRKNIERIVNKPKAENDIVVGIHIRRGDFAKACPQFCFEVLSYINVMKSILEIFIDKKVGFLICSEEKLDESSFLGLNVCFGSGHAVEDLYCLAECDYIVGPPSTYSLWASIYGNKPLYQLRDTNLAVTPCNFSTQYYWD